MICEQRGWTRQQLLQENPPWYIALLRDKMIIEINNENKKEQARLKQMREQKKNG